MCFTFSNNKKTMLIAWSFFVLWIGCVRIGSSTTIEFKNMILDFIPNEYAETINPTRNVHFYYSDDRILSNILQELWLRVEDFSGFLINYHRFLPNEEMTVGRDGDIKLTFVDHIEPDMYDVSSVVKIEYAGTIKYIKFRSTPDSYDACNGIYDLVEVFPKQVLITVYEE